VLKDIFKINRTLKTVAFALTVTLMHYTAPAQSTGTSTPQTDPDTGRIKPFTAEKNQFHGLRQMALDVSPEQLGLANIKKNEIYGVILDWNLDKGIVTLVCYQTGDASMYLSSGGGVIGGGMHENVNLASRYFVEQADRFRDFAVKTEFTPLPEKDCITFYFLTKKGKYIAGENMNSIRSNISPWADYFNEANKVITELRLLEESP